MHMADALISPAVGGTMWLVSGGLLAYCARHIRTTASRDHLTPLMGVLGAFIFAAQMINFSIPATGSSGHLGGGLILAILLGPHAAFLVMASVLTVQALFFQDGGLLALGCNIFNLGFYSAFVAYPLIYRPLVRDRFNRPMAWWAAVLAAVVSLELGAFSVVLQTKASGITELPFGTFAALMLPIHMAIGIGEGLATAAVIAFVSKTYPEVLSRVPATPARTSLRPLLALFILLALIIGGVLSWFASANPDGLEWSIAWITGKETVEGKPGEIHQRLAEIQEKTAILPDYGFRSSDAESTGTETSSEESPAPAWPQVDAGTTLAGLVGSLLTLALAVLIGFAARGRTTPTNSTASEPSSP